jgi:hypothetical protein
MVIRYYFPYITQMLVLKLQLDTKKNRLNAYSEHQTQEQSLK